MTQKNAYQTQYLADYRPYPFRLNETRLRFRLADESTVVESELDLTRQDAGPLILDGGTGLQIMRLAINGRELTPAEFIRTDEVLTINEAALPGDMFTFAATVRIDPAANTAFEGLYLSGGMFCTQCEAEGFRHITFYPDRPDVMAPFRVVIESDKPVLLSNGNPVSVEPGRAEWHDPWPKPAYLFALVAGDLVAISDSFTTKSGRNVALNVWVRPGDQDRAGFAMESLIKSMKWDEDVYGREYDLDVFNIVAVDDFNMGAMENKGLNIFNSKLVLASPETATDDDYNRIEGVIAHEYFHNWTGNRVTCRDWFQLCLKEGLTVFRDQQFTSDMRSAPVKRIEDVQTLRARQFREDQGPLAHPVRPDHYQEINNFYTATVYEKGAEVIGMLKRLVGEDGYKAALDLYFDRHDGDAATIEDWLKVFEDATGRDLAQFKRWYTDAGTPRLRMNEEWANGTLTLRFTQTTPPTPGQDEKPPRVIPIAVGLIGPNGDELRPTEVLEMTGAEQSFSFAGFGARPITSVLRGFSAPVVLERDLDDTGRAFLLAHDTDPFVRWESGRGLALTALQAMAQGGEPDAAYIDAIGQVAGDDQVDPAFRALCLQLPPEDEIAARLADAGVVPDPDAIHAAHQRLARTVAKTHEDLFDRLYNQMQVQGAYVPDADGAAQRALRNVALARLSLLDGGARATAQFAGAGNMTERFAALAALIRAGNAGDALAQFQQEFSGNRLVMDKWFMIQPAAANPDQAAAITRQLSERPDFDWKNPNRFRSLLGGLAANHAGFHAADGQGYDVTADWLIRMDAANPQIAARMSSAFETWSRYDAGRREKSLAALQRIAATPRLSRNTSEMVSRMIEAAK